MLWLAMPCLGTLLCLSLSALPCLGAMPSVALPMRLAYVPSLRD
jgi:hypothetical protein